VSDIDARELAACYELLAGSLFRYALLVARGEEPLAEDVVQDAFQQAATRWAKVRDYPDEGRLAWLKVVVRNKVYDAYRRRRTVRDKEAELPPPRPGDGRSAYDEAMVRLAGAELWSAVSTLPQRQYLVAVMRFRDEMTIAAIAAELKVSTGTVSSDIRKVRSVMREAASRYLGPDGAELWKTGR
jgi:RNA polymerase sigma-70 factor (ECF subfamily)